MVKNHRGQIVEKGPAKIERTDKPKRERGVEDMLSVRNRKAARRDAKRAKIPAKARGKLSQFLRAEDKKRAETAAEVIDPETGKTREEAVEQRVKRKGLSVIKNQIIGGKDR